MPDSESSRTRLISDSAFRSSITRPVRMTAQPSLGVETLIAVDVVIVSSFMVQPSLPSRDSNGFDPISFDDPPESVAEGYFGKQPRQQFLRIKSAGRLIHSKKIFQHIRIRPDIGRGRSPRYCHMPPNLRDPIVASLRLGVN